MATRTTTPIAGPRASAAALASRSRRQPRPPWRETEAAEQLARDLAALVELGLVDLRLDGDGDLHVALVDDDA